MGSMFGLLMTMVVAHTSNRFRIHNKINRAPFLTGLEQGILVGLLLVCQPSPSLRLGIPIARRSGWQGEVTALFQPHPPEFHPRLGVGGPSMLLDVYAERGVSRPSFMAALDANTYGR